MTTSSAWWLRKPSMSPLDSASVALRGDLCVGDGPSSTPFVGRLNSTQGTLSRDADLCQGSFGGGGLTVVDRSAGLGPPEGHDHVRGLHGEDHLAGVKVLGNSLRTQPSVVYRAVPVGHSHVVVGDAVQEERLDLEDLGFLLS